MPIWTPTIELSPEGASALITRQFPELAPVTLSLMGIGFDNSAFLVNDAFVFRFPRREVAVPLIEREVRILPLLAPHLPQPIPVPLFIGEADATFPYPFAGYRQISGRTACQVGWADVERGKNAGGLAQFLRALHGVSVSTDTLAWAPPDEIERTNLIKRAPIMSERLRRAAESVPDMDIAPLLDAVDCLKEMPAYAGPPCWVHGDLYPRHLLVDEDYRVCGVIDWGDVHIGDPALDLSVAFTFLPPEARDAFRTAYGGIDDATWDRALFRALSYAGILMEYGRDIGDEAIRAIGEHALRTALR